MLVGELDENVFEAGSERTNFGDSDAVLQELGAEMIEIESVVDQRVDGLAENGGAANAGNGASGAQSAGDVRRGDFDAISAVGVARREVRGGRRACRRR